MRLKLSGQDAITIRDPEAVALARLRAQTEHRSVSNAAAVSILEALADRFRPQDTAQGQADQPNPSANSPTTGGPRPSWRQGTIVK